MDLYQIHRPEPDTDIDETLGAFGADMLDRIDEIVPPGVNVNPADTGWDPPWITDSSLRRTSFSTRSRQAAGTSSCPSRAPTPTGSHRPPPW